MTPPHMPFTDDDLKRYKELAARGYLPSYNETKALIVRLEAAEKVLNSSHADDGGTMSVCLPECPKCTANEDWRKAAGKGTR